MKKCSLCGDNYNDNWAIELQNSRKIWRRWAWIEFFLLVIIALICTFGGKE